MDQKTKIHSELRKNESYIREKFENCADILIRPMRLGSESKIDCLMVYIEVAVSNMMLDASALGKMINHFWEISPGQIQEFMRNNSLGIADVQKLADMEEVLSAVLAGNAVFFIDGYDKAMKISSKGYPDMGVSEAKSEKVLRGSKEGFSDSVKTNSALGRKRIRNSRMKVEDKTTGVRSKTVLQLLYMEDLVQEDLLENIKTSLDEYRIDGIFDSGMLEQLTEDSWFSPFPQYQTTERPDRASKEILNGNTAERSLNMPTEMHALAAEMRFEEAQAIKRKYDLLESYRSKSEVVSNVLHNIDVFSIEDDGNAAYINYLHVTNGSINQAFTFEYKKRLNESPEELLTLGIAEKRERYKSRAKEIITPFPIDVEMEGVTFTVPQRGDKKKLLELSILNVKQYKLDRLKQAEKLNP